MFRVNKCSLAAHFLCLCHNVKCNGCLTRRFRAVYFYNPASRKSAYSKRHIKRQRACRNNFNVNRICVAEFHNTSCTVFLFYNTEYRFKSLFLFLCVSHFYNFRFTLILFFCHLFSPLKYHLYFIRQLYYINTLFSSSF